MNYQRQRIDFDEDDQQERDSVVDERVVGGSDLSARGQSTVEGVFEALHDDSEREQSEVTDFAE